MNKTTQLILEKQQQINILSNELEEQMGYALSDFKNNLFFHLYEDKDEKCTKVEAVFTIPHLQQHENYQSVKELRITFFLIEDEFTFSLSSDSYEQKISNKIAILYLHENEFRNNKINYNSWFNESKDQTIEDFSKTSLKKFTTESWNKNIYQAKESQYSLIQFVKMINTKYMTPYINNLFTSTEKKIVFIEKYNEKLNQIIEHINSQLPQNKEHATRSIHVVGGIDYRSEIFKENELNLVTL